MARADLRAGADLRAVRMLDGSGAQVAAAGGKAAALDRLVALGFPVPPAAVLGTQVYRDVAAQSVVAAAIERMRQSDTPGEVERRAVDEAFLAAQLPDGVAEELGRITHSLCPHGEPMAVRSSATAEDSARVSFAGQYRSFLGVRTEAELERAVRLVWAALWHPAPTVYRRYWGVPDDDVAMSVLLMRHVTAVTAGVAFTVDPTSGRDLVRVEWVPGAADRLVRGEVTPTVRLLEREGVVPDSADVPLGELRDLVLRTETVFGRAQDVEWVFDGERVHLVQARPMTTAVGPSAGDGFDVGPSEPATLVTAGIGEMLPGRLPPLVWETNCFLVEEALRTLFDGLGTLPDPLPGAHELVARVGGQARLNFDLLRRVADATPGASVEDLERQYFGEPTDSDVPPQEARMRPWEALRWDLRASRVRRCAVQEGLIVTSAANEVTAARRTLAALSDVELLAYRSRLVDLGARTMVAETAIAAAAVAAYRRLEARLEAYGGTVDAVGAAQLFTQAYQDEPGRVTPLWQQLWQQLCAVAEDSAEVAAALATEVSWDEAHRELSGRPPGRRFLEDLESTARTAGSMAAFAGPTWQEDLALAWQAVTGAWRRRATGEGSVAAQRRAAMDRLASSARWKRERLVGAMLIDLPRLLLEHRARDARRLLTEREQLKRTLLQIGGEVRRVHAELGSRLAGRGQLLEVDHVHHMSSAELTAALSGHGPAPHLLAVRGRRLEQAVDPGLLPDVVPATGSPPGSEDSGNRLAGWPASAGRYTGPARVVTTPDDRFDAGDVLVARTTDPSWLPLFLRAGAVVVEEGGPLSHAAIVARELGLPAILNVPDIVRRVRGRDVELTVDGAQGIVVVHDGVPAADGAATATARGAPPDDPAERAPEPAEALALSVPARPPADIDGPGIDRLSIFVPAVMAGGLLFSLVILLREVVERTIGERRLLRRGALFGHETAAVVLTGTHSGKHDTVGLRPRVVYAAIGLVFCGLAVYVLPGATLNYLHAGYYNADIAWMLAWSLLAVLFFAVIGVTNLVVAGRYRHVPTWALPLLFATPLGQVTISDQGARPGAPPERPEPPGRWPSRRLARRIRLAGWLWGVIAIGTFLGLADIAGLPRTPEGGIMGRSIEEPLQLGLLALLAVGMLVAWKLEAVGLVMMAVAATGLGFLASVEYPPPVALLVTAIFFVPAVLLWVAHQSTRPLRSLLTLALATSLLLTGVWSGASLVYGHYFGPAHPSSPLRPVPVDRVEWSWAGALTSDSFTVTARLARGGDRVRLAVGTDPELTDARYVESAAAPADDDQVVRFQAAGLAPGTRYHYGVEVDGRLDKVARGRITTAPAGPASFTFAVAGCARTGSNGAVFDAIRAADPLFFLNTGDFFYGNIDRNDVALFRAEYDANLTAPAQAELYRSTPVAYVWDDHDYGPNDADSTSPTRVAAHEAYRRYVPHYPLAGQPGGPIYQSFTVGRVRFLLTDTRSNRSPDSVPEEDRSMLGAGQRAWLEQELLAARDRYALVVWVNPNPWIAPGSSGSDSWGGYEADRRRIADFIADSRITNLLMLSGDGHMLAIDDGSNSDYSARGSGGFPVFQAAPLDRRASVKGGPYSEGTSTEGGQFGLVTVSDHGSGPVDVTLSGRTYTGAEVLSYQFTAGTAS